MTSSSDTRDDAPNSARSIALAAMVFVVVASLLNPQQIRNWADTRDSEIGEDLANLWAAPVESVSDALALDSPRETAEELLDTSPTLDTLPPATIAPTSTLDNMTTTSAVPSVSTTTGFAPTTTLEPRPTPHVIGTADRPLRVMIIGDSLASDAALGLERRWGTSDTIEFFNRGILGFGFASPLVTTELVQTDWAQRMADVRPDVVFMIDGGNEFEGVVDAAEPVGSAAWQAYLRDFVALVPPILGAGDAKVYWLTMPTTRDDKYPEVPQLNDIFAEVAATWGTTVTLIDTDQAVGGAGGVFDQELREPDGVHFSAAGEDALAAHLEELLRMDGWLG